MSYFLKSVLFSKFSTFSFSKFFFGYLISANFLFLFYLFDDHSIPIPIVFFSTLFFSFLIGYSALFSILKSIGIPPFVKFIIYLTVGFCFYILWTFFTSAFSIQPLVVYPLLAFSTVIIFFYNKHKNSNSQNLKDDYLINYDENKTLVNNKQKKNNELLNQKNILLFSILIIFAVFIMLIFNHFEWWPPHGDYETHGVFSTIQIHEGKFASEIPFHPDMEIIYPLGIHVFSANSSLLYDITVAEFLLTLSGITVFLIFGIVMSIVLLFTKSIWLVSIVFISLFDVNNIDNIINDNIIGVNGGFSFWAHLVFGLLPSFVSFLIFLSFFLLILSTNTKSKLTLFLLAVAGAIVYPPTIVYSILAIMIFYITKILNKQNNTDPNKTHPLAPRLKLTSLFNMNILLVMVILFSLAEGSIIDFFQSFANSLEPTLEDRSRIYGLSESVIVDFYIVPILIGIFSSIYVIIKIQEFRFIGLFTLFLISLMLLLDSFGQYEFLFFGSRYIILVPIFSWITASLVVYSFIQPQLTKLNFNFKHKKNKLNEKKIVSTLSTKIFSNTPLRKYMIMILFTLFVIYFVAPDIPMMYENKIPVSFTREANVTPYVDGMKWIVNNIDSNDLIFSYVGESAGVFAWIQSIEYKQIISSQPSSFVDPITRGNLNAAMKNYHSSLNLQINLIQYDVNYVVITNQGPSHQTLQSYNFLETIYDDGFTTVFEVYRDDDLLKRNLHEALTTISKIPTNADKKSKEALEGLKRVEELRRLFPEYFEFWIIHIRLMEYISGDYYEIKPIYDDFINYLDVNRHIRSNIITNEQEFDEYYVSVLEQQANFALKYEKYADAIISYDKILGIKKIDLATSLKQADALEKFKKIQK